MRPVGGEGRRAMGSLGLKAGWMIVPSSLSPLGSASCSTFGSDPGPDPGSDPGSDSILDALPDGGSVKGITAVSRGAYSPGFSSFFSPDSTKARKRKKN